MFSMNCFPDDSDEEVTSRHYGGRDHCVLLGPIELNGHPEQMGLTLLVMAIAIAFSLLNQG